MLDAKVKAKLRDIVRDLSAEEREKLYDWTVKQLQVIRGEKPATFKICPFLSMAAPNEAEFTLCEGPRCSFYNKKLRVCALVHIAMSLHTLAAPSKELLERART